MNAHPGRCRRRHWFSWCVGLAAFLWILIRTGADPKRVTYPCQQAAMPLAAGWLLSMGALLAGGAFLRRFTRISGTVAFILGVVWLMTTSVEFTSANTGGITTLPVWEVPNPVSTVFVMDSIPRTIGSLAAGDSTVPDAYLVDPAIDTLLQMMATKGIHLHRTPSQPNGLIRSNDIVVIKGNYQWTSRNTTSADRVKGLIRQILTHPDGFSGEIIVCDNTQEIGTGINDNDNNSEDPSQSIVDVVNTFRAKHYPVYLFEWNSFWGVVASEYSQGDYSNGYVYEPPTKISYPKFRSPSGRHYVSLRYGIWDSVAGTYDHSRLCIIDFPVLKAHSIAGATIALKNWIGTLTTAYATERYGGRTAMHNTYMMGTFALVARVMAVTFPRLTIVDAAWTTTDGPISLTYVQNTKMLLGSTDPVASSWYAAKFILTPIARYPNSTNPDRVGSAYKNSLDNWTRFLRDSAGLPCTKDSSRISVYDRRVLQQVSVEETRDVPGQFALWQNYPNPFNPATEIRYQLPEVGHVRLRVFDILGREVASLVNDVKGPGIHSAQFDASGLASGVYFYCLTVSPTATRDFVVKDEEAGQFVAVKKMVVMK